MQRSISRSRQLPWKNSLPDSVKGNPLPSLKPFHSDERAKRIFGTQDPSHHLHYRNDEDINVLDYRRDKWTGESTDWSDLLIQLCGHPTGPKFPQEGDDNPYVGLDLWLITQNDRLINFFDQIFGNFLDNGRGGRNLQIFCKL